MKFDRMVAATIVASVALVFMIHGCVTDPEAIARQDRRERMCEAKGGVLKATQRDGYLCVIKESQ